MEKLVKYSLFFARVIIYITDEDGTDQEDCGQEQVYNTIQDACIGIGTMLQENEGEIVGVEIYRYDFKSRISAKLNVNNETDLLKAFKKFDEDPDQYTHLIFSQFCVNKQLRVEYHRPPTPYEIKFGEGATHYLEFDIERCIKPDGTLKRWVICPVTGLRYYR